MCIRDRPFTTSTLQQTASSRLGFGASRTMQIAQKLYQGIEIEGETIGLITYMRTDGTNLSKDAILAFRDYIKKEIGADYLPGSALNYSGKKAKNAQEAHEAIRPTDIIRTPQSVKKYLSADQNKLYDLIWSRALSSQMESAKFDRNTITIASDNNDTVCKSSGSVLKFDGFLKIYKNLAKDDEETVLPEMSKGLVNIEALIDEQHFTQPPPRYSEASLVKKLEELGIGRPSTYASIISTIANRGYAVFQMNFRGSTGYGREFWEISFKEWGKSMQDDITDGVNWLIKEGIADPGRVAIYGASYGGYATLAGLAFTPDLYACGVDYVGVSSIFTMMESIPPYWELYRSMQYEMIGDPVKDKELLESVSPLLHVDKIKAPLFVAQGANDPRVKKSESDQMVEALKARGIDVPYMVKENEGHGFYNEENQFDFYREMEKFLKKHIG